MGLLLDFVAECVLEPLTDRFPVVDKIYNGIIQTAGYMENEVEQGRGKFNIEFDRGYQHACSMNLDALEKEVHKRKNNGQRDPYTLGMMNRYKELK